MKNHLLYKYDALKAGAESWSASVITNPLGKASNIFKDSNPDLMHDSIDMNRLVDNHFNIRNVNPNKKSLLENKIKENIENRPFLDSIDGVKNDLRILTREKSLKEKITKPKNWKNFIKERITGKKHISIDLKLERKPGKSDQATIPQKIIQPITEEAGQTIVALKTSQRIISTNDQNTEPRKMSQLTGIEIESLSAQLADSNLQLSGIEKSSKDIPNTNISGKQKPVSIQSKN